MAQYKYSRDDYYRLTNAPCIDVALALGMEINERASDQKAWKMKDEQGLCIYREGNNWYRFSDGRHGFSIDLVIDKLGCSREQALDFIAKNVVNGVSEQVRLDHKAPAKVKKELPKEKIFTVPDHDVKPSRVMAYLIKTRGIDPEIVKGMLQRKMIAEDSAHHNCLFFGRDEKGNIRSCAQRGTTQVQFRGEVSGGDKAYTFAMNGKSNVLRLFESPIDAMSHATFSKLLGALWALTFQDCPAYYQTLRSIGTTEDVAQWSAYLHCNFNNAAEAGKDTPYYAPLQKLAYRALGVLRCVYAVLLPLAFVWAVVRHLCALPMVLRRRTAGAVLPWLLLFGLLAIAALRCGMIAFVEVSSFGIGTSTMYLSTVHPLLLLYTYGCLICYHNKGVITE